MARKRTKASDEPVVARTIEEAQEVGFLGRKIDPKPNSAYTLTGGAAEPAETSGPEPATGEGEGGGSGDGS